jgi:hypothetical protein
MAMGSLRTHMMRQLWLAVSVGAQIGIVSAQWTALKKGADVVLTREQLSTFGHPSMPANLNDHATWTLSGDDRLTPAS